MLYNIALTLVKGVGDYNLRSLISHCGDAQNVFKAQAETLKKIPGIGPKTAQAILSKQTFARAEKELAFIEKYKIKPLFFTDTDFPKRLHNCEDAPAMLYFKGNANINNQKIIAVVGTRNATPYGKIFCEKLISGLKKYNLLVVSGLAYGIDIAAHKAALGHQVQTLGVLGHGLDRIYPALHRSTAEKMLDCGGLITEFPSETNPDRQNFPKRNRIIAGMADATIVVEAAVTGGALITAQIANSYNRDVFALPGRVDEEFSEGCNYLIKTNRAQLITKVEDIEYILGWVQAKLTPKPQQLSIYPNLSSDEQKIVKLIAEKNSVSFDDLQNNLDMPQSKMAMAILNLEMQTIIIALPGKVYKLN
ncbi:MAG: DNA-protecting protein DprA [Sphingobacteriales bacterium]|nr:MAG: DNA-protecting protein DprA [Sphingobacteriales bacterium]TAF83181.1 MAG: DNA-protecting protein DprA [Sphingobacteriales bacterium]